MIYRVKIKPRSAWQTPWEADTLSGLLCATMAREIGADALQAEIIQPALAGNPPFALSDALPGDLLPVPLAARLLPWKPDERKQIKRARYVTPEIWSRFGGGEPIGANTLIPASAFVPASRLRNVIARDTGTTGENALFESEAHHLAKGTDYLSVYFWREKRFASRLWELFNRLAGRGYGGDVSVGYGQFEICGTPEPVPIFQKTAGSLVSLSTWQPGRADPVNGYWETITKRGKVGADFGLENKMTAKNPLVLLRPGACFVPNDNQTPWVGRAIPMHELLQPEAATHLREQDVEIIQYAFGLVVPCAISLR